ncbi:MAG: fluoride efflux transporter CrcB [Bacteroidales bacterium]|jgi:CrcB protein|nr:fluoride efflux transporter CrcB [Bacteroidales bacterium]NPV37478.1 fluoride efflux transporter CrcB [Bacteroidales bacterium]
MLKYALITGLGGFIGSALRYSMQRLSTLIFPISFPYGTFIVNLIGALLIGILFAISEQTTILGPQWRIFAITGVLGGFTTFSSFTLDTMNLLRESQYLYAFTYVSLTVFLGIAITIVGYLMMKNLL